MARQKGNALCHTYTETGRNNHETIRWNSDHTERCPNLRYIGKRKECLLSDPKLCISKDKCLNNK